MSEDLSEILLHTPESVMDKPDPRDHHPTLGKEAAQKSIDQLLALPGLEEFSPGPSNQGRWSSCTSHAVGNGTDMIRRRWFSTGDLRQVSRNGAYNAIRHSLGQLDRDEGLTVRDLMAGIRDHGFIDSEIWEPRTPHESPPHNYVDFAIRYPGRYYNLPMVTDEAVRLPQNTHYSLRLWLQHIKIERLPIFVATKIPEGDMRSPYVRATGIRSKSPYRSHDDLGYWHEECVEDIVDIDGEIYVVLLGSWGLVGKVGRFFVPWENFLDRFYSGQAFGPKEDWA